MSGLTLIPHAYRGLASLATVRRRLRTAPPDRQTIRRRSAAFPAIASASRPIVHRLGDVPSVRPAKCPARGLIRSPSQVAACQGARVSELPLPGLRPGLAQPAGPCGSAIVALLGAGCGSGLWPTVPMALTRGGCARCGTGSRSGHLSALLIDCLAILIDCFTVGRGGRVRTCRVPQGPRVSIVRLGPPATGGRSGDSIF